MPRMSHQLGIFVTLLLMTAGVVFLAGVGPAPNQARASEASLAQLEDQVMCPICGTLLGLSRSPAAERERAFIRRLIAQGQTEDQIKDALVREYGPQALALPDDQGINIWAYIVPVGVFVVAILSVIFTLLGWKRNRGDSNGLTVRKVSESDDERLDRDLARFQDESSS